MTQEQLAMMLGVSRQSVTKWEAEKSYPEMDKLIKICQIFEVTLDDLVTGDVTQGELAPRTAVPIPKIPVDSCGYDELMRSYALKASTGAALFFLSIAPPMILTSGVLQTLGVPDIPLGVGMAITFALMAAGIALIVLAVTGKSGFERQHPYIQDFYTEDDREHAFTVRTVGFGAGSFSLFLSFAAIALLTGFGLPDTCAGAAAMLLFSIAVWLFAYSSLLYARVDLERYNQKNLRRLGEKELDMLDVGGAEQKRIREQWKRSRKLAWMSNTIMLLATCLAIILMFTAPPVFFLPWVVAAVLCSILRNRERNRVA